jgi:YteA family regulatory protein
LAEEKGRLEKSIKTLGAAGLDRSLGDSISESAVYDNHPADIATETFEREKDFGLREDQMTTLGLVEKALRRLEDGTYGACERCGQAIPAARLEAVPWTAFCVRCEATLEREVAGDRGRPAEEGVRPPFSSFAGLGPSGQVEYDGGDAWQAVARYGTSSSVAHNPPEAFDESGAGQDESAGLVEAVDAIPDSSHDPGRAGEPEHPTAGRPGSTALEGGGRSRRTRERKRRPGR